MMPPTDLELLERYRSEASEEAFAQLVHRHIDLVYSAALRQVRSPQLAEEISQSVFHDLSRKAGTLAQRAAGSLTPWLYQVTRRTAIDVVRRESRRQLREQLAAELTEMNNHPSLWNQIEPLLEEAMDTLDHAERELVLLRFFENKSLREVGQSLGTSEEAAQKRVSRAVERLRDFFSKRGVAIGAGSLVAVLSAQAVQSAPLGLGTAICSAAGSATALQSLNIGTFTKLIAMTTIQKVLITVVLTSALGAAIYQGRRAVQLQRQSLGLQQEHASLNEQIHQLQRERDDANSRLIATRQENEELRSSTAELPKLRAEVGRLHDTARDLAQLRAAAGTNETDPQLESAFKTWALRASRVRERLLQSPDQRIPELQLASDKVWFDAVKGLTTLESDADFQKAFSNARNNAKGEFGELMQKALRGYLGANDGQLPSNLAQLKPFFSQPVDDAVLQRYTLLQTGKLTDVASGQYLIAETAPLVNQDSDATFKFTLNGTDSHSGNPFEDAVKASVFQYASEHGDLLPTDPAQLTPYLKQPVPMDKLQSLFAKVPPGVTTLRQLKATME